MGKTGKHTSLSQDLEAAGAGEHDAPRQRLAWPRRQGHPGQGGAVAQCGAALQQWLAQPSASRITTRPAQKASPHVSGARCMIQPADTTL